MTIAMPAPASSSRTPSCWASHIAWSWASAASTPARLNTAIAAEPIAQQNNSGFLACDLAGFPNGRRPYDDVVDIELTVVEGALTGTTGLQTCDPSGATPVVKNAGAVVNDGAEPVAASYLTVFPYLNTPVPGSTAAP